MHKAIDLDSNNLNKEWIEQVKSNTEKFQIAV